MEYGGLHVQSQSISHGFEITKRALSEQKIIMGFLYSKFSWGS